MFVRDGHQRKGLFQDIYIRKFKIAYYSPLNKTHFLLFDFILDSLQCNLKDPCQRYLPINHANTSLQCSVCIFNSLIFDV